MAEFKFNKPYKDKELDRLVNTNERVEMTIKRADEIVKTVRQAKGYEDFEYERLDKPESKKGKESE